MLAPLKLLSLSSIAPTKLRWRKEINSLAKSMFSGNFQAAQSTDRLEFLKIIQLTPGVIQIKNKILHSINHRELNSFYLVQYLEILNKHVLSGIDISSAPVADIIHSVKAQTNSNLELLVSIVFQLKISTIRFPHIKANAVDQIISDSISTASIAALKRLPIADKCKLAWAISSIEPSLPPKIWNLGDSQLFTLTQKVQAGVSICRSIDMKSSTHVLEALEWLYLIDFMHREELAFEFFKFQCDRIDFMSRDERNRLLVVWNSFKSLPSSNSSKRTSLINDLDAEMKRKNRSQVKWFKERVI
jgi:hypothetical protein